MQTQININQYIFSLNLLKPSAKEAQDSGYYMQIKMTMKKEIQTTYKNCDFDNPGSEKNFVTINIKNY